MNVVVATNYKRPERLLLAVESMIKNATEWSKHHLTVVYNGDDFLATAEVPPTFNDVTIIAGNVGASASRNIGASSIPKYRRQSHVCFLDDDVYCCPGWDTAIDDALKAFAGAAVSGHAHPFNHAIGEYHNPHAKTSRPTTVSATNVLSTVNIVCAWSMFDDVGWFAEPGGPGGSEDVDWCKRATEKGYGLAVTNPHCVIHCGLTSSRGEKIVGYDLMVAQNEALVKDYGIEGKVRWE